MGRALHVRGRSGAWRIGGQKGRVFRLVLARMVHEFRSLESHLFSLHKARASPLVPHPPFESSLCALAGQPPDSTEMRKIRPEAICRRLGSCTCVLDSPSRWTRRRICARSLRWRAPTALAASTTRRCARCCGLVRAHCLVLLSTPSVIAEH
jgi:hypothetical protein